MISRKYKAIFIHIEKTAGTSIENKLGLFETLNRGVQDHRKIRYFEHISKHSHRLSNLKYFFYCFRRAKYRKSYNYLKNIIFPELTRNEYKTFYKFTFVRNTWSRVYSFYYNVINDKVLRDNHGITTACTFRFFIENVLDHKNFNQMDYIKDINENIPMDFIGRFENLEQDFLTVCKSLLIKDSALPKLLHRSNKEHYTKFYDEETINLVYKYFKEEIDFFNFKFGE